MSLDRFKQAQRSARDGYQVALEEIRSGGKRGHWIWYVLPQIRGLGSSGNARTFAIEDAAEAADYLRDQELRGRLLEIAKAIAERLRARRPASLRALMGSHIDALKTVSSLTLFGRVAERLSAAEGLRDCEELARVANEVLSLAAAEGYPPCRATLRALGEIE